MTNKLLTIVIPIFNQWRYTANCLASIFQSNFQKELYDIVMVDNASTDVTPEFLSYLLEQEMISKVLANEKNKDYLLGANQGWKEAKTPYCLLLNNDIILHKNALEYMMYAFSKDPKIGIVGGIQVSENRPPRMAKTLFYRGEEVDKHEDLRYLVDMTQDEVDSYFVEVETTGFCCAIVKRELWEKIGYFDERFCPSMSEQEDYNLRAREAGFKVVVVPKARYVHFVGVTTTGNIDFYQKVLRRNRALFLDKWGEKLRKNLI